MYNTDPIPDASPQPQVGNVFPLPSAFTGRKVYFQRFLCLLTVNAPTSWKNGLVPEITLRLRSQTRRINDRAIPQDQGRKKALPDSNANIGTVFAQRGSDSRRIVNWVNSGTHSSLFRQLPIPKRKRIVPNVLMENLRGLPQMECRDRRASAHGGPSGSCDLRHKFKTKDIATRMCTHVHKNHVRTSHRDLGSTLRKC